MHAIPLPGTDNFLQLSPRWGDVWSWQAGVLLLLAVVPVVLVLSLYRYELKLVSRWTARGLVALRLVVIALLWFLVCLQPTVARSPSSDVPGRVIVAVDLSDSMNVADPQRLPVEKLRLARTLKLTGDLCSDLQLAEWVQQYEQNPDGPTWAAADEHPDDSARRKQLADSRHRQHDQVCERVDTWTRTQVARQLLASEGGQLLQALADKHHVELFGFAQEARAVKPAGDKPDPKQMLEQLFQPTSVAAAPVRKPETVAFITSFTDLNQPLARALEGAGPDQGKILGVVLLTDGQHNHGAAPGARAEELGKWKVPIYPVPIGSSRPRPNLSLEWVKAPPAVMKDVVVPIEARLRVSGMPAQDLVVTLQRSGQPDGPPLRTQTIRYNGTDQPELARFEMRLDQTGTHAFTVTARPADRGPRGDDPRQPVVIKVDDEHKPKVLVLDSEGRWEYHYLASALLRDRALQIDRVLLQPPLLNAGAMDADLDVMGNPRRTFPAGFDALHNYDCIILGDVAPDQLPLFERKQPDKPEISPLEEYVAEHGGTLVIVAGKRSMPLAYYPESPLGGAANLQGAPKAPPADNQEVLRKLLPITEPRVVKSQQGFPITLTAEGKLTKFLQLEDVPSESEKRWSLLPRHYWGVAGKAKPGAASLAYFPDDETKPAPKDAKEAADRAEKQGREQALILRHNYGYGRVVYVGLDSTWRWRYKEGDTYHHRFWGQVIRWAVSGKPLARFGASEPVYAQGKDVEVYVRLDEAIVPEVPAKIDIGARIIRLAEGNRAEEVVAVVPLKGAAKERLLKERVANLPAGQYAVELSIPDAALAARLIGAPADGPPARPRSTFLVTPAYTEERSHLEVNEELLNDLAQKSGGRVFPADRAGELVSLLTRHDEVHVERTEHKLWQSWGTLVLVLALLTVEWVGRKLAGLP